ncbi:MAG: hypothetical protein NZ534_08635, partial [Bacteroidia bacterium]|nr:hypothetical protein [Bacteroidia bacterium]
MRVRYKLTLIFLSAMVLSILLTISFAILFVRRHLAQRRAQILEQEARRIEAYLSARGPGFWHDKSEREAF